MATRKTMIRIKCRLVTAEIKPLRVLYQYLLVGSLYMYMYMYIYINKLCRPFGLFNVPTWSNSTVPH